MTYGLEQRVERVAANLERLEAELAGERRRRRLFERAFAEARAGVKAAELLSRLAAAELDSAEELLGELERLITEVR